MGSAEVNDMKYHVDNLLINYWTKNSLKKMLKQNSDKVIIVDGRERTGKSTWAIQQMGFLEPEVFKDTETFLSRVCIDVTEFNETARRVKNGVVIFDEGFRGFSSRSALSKTNKLLIQTLMEMGQNNNILFIVLPSFFLLDMYPALLRSNVLFNIQEDARTRMRVFRGYNQADKNYMYRMGARKGWNYKNTRFRGRFPKIFPGGKKFEQAYLKKKERAFISMSDSMKDGEVLDKNALRVKKVLLHLIKVEGYTQKKAAETIGMDAGYISRLLAVKPPEL